MSSSAAMKMLVTLWSRPTRACSRSIRRVACSSLAAAAASTSAAAAACSASSCACGFSIWERRPLTRASVAASDEGGFGGAGSGGADSGGSVASRTN